MFSSQRENQLPQNDPRSLEPVRVTVTRPFCVKGQRLEVGQIVELARYDAMGLQAIGKAELTR